MKGLAKSSPFQGSLLTNPHVINRFIFGHGVFIYYISSHSFCLRRNVNEHETELTVMKLPTKDVESMCKDPEESVLLDSKSTSATFKDQPFLGQTRAWPKRTNL